MKLLLILTSLWLTAAAQAGILIVAHPNNSNTISAEDLKRLYTGKASSFASGDAAVPLNLADDNTLRAQFDQKALGRSSSQVKAYWSKLVFTGKGAPPKEVSSEAEVLKLVGSNPNLLGYVSSTADTSGVKVLLSLD
ncbi:MAG: phosphate ABC transporter substrate-binding protein [Pseudomonadota bacterium]